MKHLFLAYCFIAIFLVYMYVLFIHILKIPKYVVFGGLDLWFQDIKNEYYGLLYASKVSIKHWKNS